MAGFNVSKALNGLTDPYPGAHSILEACHNGGEQATSAIARQWLSEGIPFAFKQNPGLYDAIRLWLSIRLDVDPKEISLSGSARLGQSLAPAKFGAKFSENSDLDLFIISETLFLRMKEDFIKWSDDFDTSIVEPKNDRMRRFWADTRKRMDKLLMRGFVDPHLIPSMKRYEVIQKTNQSMSLLIRKLSETENAPPIKKASIRCYKNWGSFIRQCNLNITATKI